MKNITLTDREIISLIKEKFIEKDGIIIESTSSFLSILSILEDEIIKNLKNDRFTAA